MPRIDIIREVGIKESFRVANIKGMFNVPIRDKLRHEWKVDIPIEGKDWSIGVIYGASGSGKTTIGREIFGKKAYHKGFLWDNKKSILDGFPSEME